jgi:peptidyl-prolyl cis-trans isomerase A (cyclophilin A)
MPIMRIPRAALLGLGLTLTVACATRPAQPVRPALVKMATAMGEIDVEVDLAHAPVTSASFLLCVENGRYDGGRFHRTVRPDTEVRRDVPIEVIQAGAAATWCVGFRLPPRWDRPSHRRSPSSRPVAFAEGRRVYDAWHG